LVFFDYFFVELILFSTIFVFTYVFNVTILLFTAGVYLIVSGILFLIKEMDVLIGFLWVIDLGVGLIFFIFTLHFSAFLNQKSVFSSSSKNFFVLSLMLLFSIIYFYFFSRSVDSSLNSDLGKTWFLSVIHTNLFSSLFNNDTNVLMMLKYSYFSFNSFEFFLINYSLFFGLVCSILSVFLLKRFYSKIIFSQIKESKSIENVNSGFFIRNQNFSFQQNVHQSTRIWSKVKNN